MNTIQAFSARPDETALLAALNAASDQGRLTSPPPFDMGQKGESLAPAALLAALSPLLFEHDELPMACPSNAPAGTILVKGLPMACPSNAPAGTILVKGLHITFPDAAAAVAKSFKGLAELASGSASTGASYLEVSSSVSLRHALAVLLTSCVLQEAWDKEKQHSPDAVAKFIAILNAAEAPYYLRYLLSRQTIQSPELFEALRPALQPSNMRLHFGHSQQHRFDALDVLFKGGQTFVDIGCGKATYLRTIASRYKHSVGFEAHGPTRAEAKAILSRLNLEKVRVYGGFDTEKFIPEGSHVLMTEVLEHMPKEKAVALLQTLGAQTARLMVFTVPNRDFNVYYGMPAGEFRHWDHHWEPSFDEFETMMRELLGNTWTLDIYGIGDAVDGVHTGIVCLARPKKAQTKANDFSWLTNGLFASPTKNKGVI